MGFRYILIIATLLHSTYAENLDIKQGDILEKVKYSNGKIVISKIKNSKEKIFTPTAKKIVYRLKSKKLHTKYGYIYLYNLSKNGNLLNATPFDNINIIATNGVKLAIADSYLAQKEDNILLPSNNINLSSLATKIDLMRLKYVIAISKRPLQQEPISKIVFNKKDFNSNNKPTISAWAWNPNNISSKKLEKLHLSRLYLQIKDGFQDSLKNTKNLEIFGLDGSPSDINNIKKLLKDIELLKSLKKDYPNIKGFQVDIEPYLLPQYNENKSVIWRKYLTIISKLKQACQRVDLKFSVVIPYWLNHITLNGKNVGFEVVNIADEVVLMSYKSKAKLIKEISKDFLNYAHLVGKKVKIGLELMPIENEEHTIYKVQEIADCIAKNHFEKSCKILKEQNHYILRGDSISFFHNINDLKKIIKTPLNFSSFDGYVLHHYGVIKLPIFHNIP